MMHPESKKESSLKSRAEAIFESLGSDRGFKALEDYHDRLISIEELDVNLTRIEAEEKDTSQRRNLRFDNYIRVAANDVSSLRRVDVYRVMDLSCSRTGMAKYLKRHRPDLNDEVDEVHEELTGFKLK
ncbi:hypothetical protein [Microbulbifer epialgicus]|uniref:Uncharacterized protein n=1 Tax=Microbulbifer epialgicus TaxID=393907 RepID=A0ABV4NTB8_9GAMM